MWQDFDFRADQEKREDLSSRRLLPWNGNTLGWQFYPRAGTRSDGNEYGYKILPTDIGTVGYHD